MTPFWHGFEKSAGKHPTIISRWISEAEDAEESAKNKEDTGRRFDPRHIWVDDSF